ncbi:uncharacterized protein LOC107042435 [Diachasma alloeum]|uniref:uncharacterized protein LOC107042435 n=1 Tax=Diachasma alloeum TaxID=454923 RepID=UPI0007380F94|nr:uncharacterized protein LOC107042435 [Diachasma alloeum]
MAGRSVRSCGIKNFFAIESFEFRHSFLCGFLEMIYFFNPGSFQTNLFLLIKSIHNHSAPIYFVCFLKTILLRQMPVDYDNLQVFVQCLRSDLRYCNLMGLWREIQLHLDHCETCSSLCNMVLDDFNVGLNVIPARYDAFITTFRAAIKQAPSLPVISSSGATKRVRQMYQKLLNISVKRQQMKCSPLFPLQDNISVDTSLSLSLLCTHPPTKFIREDWEEMNTFCEEEEAKEERASIKSQKERRAMKVPAEKKRSRLRLNEKVEKKSYSSTTEPQKKDKRAKLKLSMAESRKKIQSSSSSNEPTTRGKRTRLRLSEMAESRKREGSESSLLSDELRKKGKRARLGLVGKPESGGKKRNGPLSLCNEPESKDKPE